MRRACQPGRRRRWLRAAHRLLPATPKELSKSAGAVSHSKIRVQAPARHAARYRLRSLAASLIEQVLRRFGSFPSSQLSGALSLLPYFSFLNKRSLEAILEEDAA